MLDMVTAKRRFLQFIKVVGHISIQIHIKKVQTSWGIRAMRSRHIGIIVKSQIWVTVTHRDRREDPGKGSEGKTPRF